MKNHDFRVYSINGVEIQFCTITVLSHITGVKSQTLRKWEKNKMLPEAYAAVPMKSPLANVPEGTLKRLYTREQAEVLAWWVAKVRPAKGLVIKESLINLLHDKWEEANVRVRLKLKNGEV